MPPPTDAQAPRDSRRIYAIQSTSQISFATQLNPLYTDQVMSDDPMKAAEDLALRFASLVGQEREAELRLTKVRAEKEDALKRLLAFKPSSNGTASESGAKEKVFELLESKPIRVFATAEVGELLGIAANVASAYLSELYNKDRRIGRIAKGRYQSLQLAPQSAKFNPLVNFGSEEETSQE